MLALIRDFIRYSLEHKKAWLLPFLVVFLGAGALLIAANSATIAPFIYALF